MCQRDIGRSRRGLLAQPVHHRDAAPVDNFVRQQHCYELTAQWVIKHEVMVFGADSRRKVAEQQLIEHRILGDFTGDQVFGDAVLRIRQEHSQLWPG